MRRDSETTTAFAAKEIEKLRKRAVRVATVRADDLPEGWSKCRADPMRVAGVFASLRVREGYVLRAYQYHWRGNGNGWVWAQPASADFPEPAEYPGKSGRTLGVPRPPDALEAMRHIFATNLFGPIAVAQAFLPLLERAPAARIVNVSSSVGSLGLTADPESRIAQLGGLFGYAASKTALNAFTLRLANELRLKRIKVNAACPGYVATDFNRHTGPRSVEPAVPAMRAPWVSWARFVTMLMTPFTAFAPQSVPPGPRMISIRSMSSSSVSCTSQYVPANRGEYTARPSTSTNIERASRSANPRIPIA